MNKETLNDRKAALLKELAMVEKLESIVEDTDFAAYLEGILVRNKSGRPSRGKGGSRVIGSQKKVLEILSEGPCTAEIMASRSGLPYKVAYMALQNTKIRGLAKMDENGVFAISELGRDRVEWFKSHPDRKSFAYIIR